MERRVRSTNSENPSGAENQQETANACRILRDCTRGSFVGTRRRMTKIQSDPHGDMRSQAEMTWPLKCKWTSKIGVCIWVVTKVPKVAKFLVG